MVATPASSLRAQASPDQVLVLYNEDWTEDLPGTEPGQDSREVAQYYVAQHTDPKTGRKPHLVGLSCRHKGGPKNGSHLLGESIEEDSSDNFFGVVYKGKGRPLLADERKRQKYYLLSASIEVPLETDRYEWDSVTLKVGRTDTEAEATVLYASGRSVPCATVFVTPLEDGRGKRFLADGSRFGPAGEMYLWVHVKDTGGRPVIDRRVCYHNFSRLRLPITETDIDWKTFQAIAGDPNVPARRAPIWREGRSVVGNHLVLHKNDDGTARLELNAEAAGMRGHFFVAWAAQTAAGRMVEGRSPVFQDRRLISVDVPDADGRVDWNTLTLRYADRDDPAAARPLWENGACTETQDLVVVRDGTTGSGSRQTPVRTLLVNAKRGGFHGDVTAWVSAKGRSEQDDLVSKARFFDPDDLEFSRTGPDGERDDRHYLEDVEQPVKAFLEDPARAENGVALKDRILYVVLCYGLPRTVTRLYGLGQTAVPDSRGDGGHLVSLCQRLETAYYDVEAVRPPQLVPARFRDKVEAFQARVPVSSHWYPLTGWGVQPYLHPAAYRKGATRPQWKPPWPPPPHFTAEARRRFPKRFLYVCSRIDADDPETAKHQVDAARYATRYLTPRIGGPAEGDWDGAKALAAADGLCGIEELRTLGFPGADESINHSAYFGRRDGGGYLPGAVDWYVISGNGRNSPTSQVSTMLRDGVTVTGGAARAYRGCPHTTTHGWWDARIFYHYLFRGYTLGEAWLLSKFKLQWCTSFFGDPLYRPDLRETRFDRAAPEVRDPADVRVEFLPAGDRYCGLLRAALHTTPENPELVAAKVEYWKETAPDAVATSADTWYRRRPSLVLRDLEPETTYGWRLVLTDPYGNTFDSRDRFGRQTFRTGEALPPLEPVLSQDNPTKFWIGGRGRKDMMGPDAGEIDLVFEARRGSGTLFRCGDLYLRISAKSMTFNPGGGQTGTAQYAFDERRVYHVRARYRRWPVTREVWLIAANGREFLLCADNRSPWRDMAWGKEMTFCQSVTNGLVRRAEVYADARVGSQEGAHPLPEFDAEAFNQADGWTGQPSEAGGPGEG